MFEKKYLYEYFIAHVDVVYPDGYALMMGLDNIIENNIGYSYNTLAVIKQDGSLFDVFNNVYLSTERNPDEISYISSHLELASNYCPIYEEKKNKIKALKCVKEYYPGFNDKIQML